MRKVSSINFCPTHAHARARTCTAKYASLSPLQALSRLTRLISGQVRSVLGAGLSKPTWEADVLSQQACMPGGSPYTQKHPVPQPFLHARAFLLQQMVSCGPPPQPRRGEPLFSQTPALSQAGKTLTRALWQGAGPCAPIQGVINDCCQSDMNAHIEKTCSLSPSLSGRQLLLSLKLLGVTHVSPLS